MVYDVQIVNDRAGLTLNAGWHLTIAAGVTVRFRAWINNPNNLRITGAGAWVHAEGGVGQGERVTIGNPNDWVEGAYTYTYWDGILIGEFAGESIFENVNFERVRNNADVIDQGWGYTIILKGGGIQVPGCTFDCFGEAIILIDYLNDPPLITLEDAIFHGWHGGLGADAAIRIIQGWVNIRNCVFNIAGVGWEAPPTPKNNRGIEILGANESGVISTISNCIFNTQGAGLFCNGSDSSQTLLEQVSCKRRETCSSCRRRRCASPPAWRGNQVARLLRRSSHHESQYPDGWLQQPAQNQSESPPDRDTSPRRQTLSTPRQALR